MNWFAAFSFLSAACLGMMVFANFARKPSHQDERVHSEAQAKLFVMFLVPFLIFGALAGLNLSWPIH